MLAIVANGKQLMTFSLPNGDALVLFEYLKGWYVEEVLYVTQGVRWVLIQCELGLSKMMLAHTAGSLLRWPIVPGAPQAGSHHCPGDDETGP